MRLPKFIKQEREVFPVCPRCGNECDTIIFDVHGFAVCCDVCEDRRDAWEAPECFPGCMRYGEQ